MWGCKQAENEKIQGKQTLEAAAPLLQPEELTRRSSSIWRAANKTPEPREEATSSSSNECLLSPSAWQPMCVQQRLQVPRTSLGWRGGLSELRLGQRARVRVDIRLNTSFQHHAEAKHTLLGEYKEIYISHCYPEHRVQLLYSHSQKNLSRNGEFG